MPLDKRYQSLVNEFRKGRRNKLDLRIAAIVASCKALKTGNRVFFPGLRDEDKSRNMENNMIEEVNRPYSSPTIDNNSPVSVEYRSKTTDHVTMGVDYVSKSKISYQSKIVRFR